MSDFPAALAGVLSSMERDQVGYVLYHERQSKRVVIFVESRSAIPAIEAALRRLGGKAGTQGSGYDFSFADEGATYDFVVELKTGAEKSSIANLLWLAAIDEGASAARDSLDHTS